ncbi:MAG: universal stress protein [Chloroflexota bacterium]
MGNSYNHILIPLDGSELAETALDEAVSLATACGAAITLIHVILNPADHVIGLDTQHPIYLDQQWASQKAPGQDYLNNIRRRIATDGLTINTAVELGAAAQTIIDYAEQHPVDLIVMATHGRSGLQQFVLGGTAGRVMRRANVSVLLVRAHQA